MTAITAQPGRKFRAAEPESRRTFQPVRRGSRWTNHRERWATLSRKEANLRIFALERYQVTTRKAGQRFGAEGTISDGAVKLFRILCNMAVKHGGRVEPSVAWLASERVLNVPMKVIHKWKAQLQEHGFLDWDRRYVETGRQGVRGPQVAQTSNAYITKLPQKALDLVKAIRKGMGLDPEPRVVSEAELAVLSPAERRKADRLAEQVAKDKARLEAAFAAMNAKREAAETPPEVPD
ncbi:hypothetical protein HNP32_001291 [Brevundimonas bullata]|uniref:Uncharacterized protein n=1 Tax=Brevundimonas bullata TaxID=13160 RepID=A0A7W7N3U7_9CAUL|nr:hypothetical protein [Brevundimonas bullata]MBB4797567.1 hypothetical protein [Brevundimonas bullata]MBB6382527.1 hypothetical protein [Brevundimonas bullata]